MSLRSLSLVSAAALLAVLPACDSSSPSGPRGRVVTLAADPTEIDLGGTSTLTVTALKPDGSPAAGEGVTLATNLGTLDDASLVLDASGRAMTTLRAGDQAGEANVVASIDAGGEVSTGVTTVTIRDAVPPQLVAEPTALDKDHILNSSPCPNPYEPVNLTNGGDGDLEFRIDGEMPEWLDAAAKDGPVPGTLDLFYTCAGEAQPQELSHTVVVVGVDPDTLEDTGDPVEIVVELTLSQGL